MVTALFVAVVLVAMLALVNLALTLTIVKRMRSQHSHAGPTIVATAADSLPAGSRVPDFTATATDGTEFTAEHLGMGRTLVAFASETCQSCHEDLPTLIAYANDFVRDGGRVIAAVLTRPPADGSDAGEGSVAAALRDVATVFVDIEGDAVVSDAFSVTGYPTYLIVQDRVVDEVLLTIRDLPVLARG
ncbi:MAG: hypothetical protein WCA46_08745 [Actinocatenispora sp.]